VFNVFMHSSLNLFQSMLIGVAGLWVTVKSAVNSVRWAVI